MKTTTSPPNPFARRLSFPACFLASFGLWLSLLQGGQALAAPDGDQAKPIPFDQLGAAAEKQYQGDGLAVSATDFGASLRCVFQKIEGQVTREGLWLSSTAEKSKGERFRIIATTLGRLSKEEARIPLTGTVEVAGKVARFLRPGVVEEYSVSVDGVRQDFLIAQKPPGDGAMRVGLDVAGAQAEALANGARLVLDGSGRKIAYSRLRVTDASGKELIARIEVASPTRLAVVVDDADAAYPVRIDPTFSDADWTSLGKVPGADGVVNVIAVDAGGTVYVGGDFNVMVDVVANHIAKWDGTTWSALGSGMNRSVFALAVSGTDLYVGGNFTTAGGTAANRIAKWNGSAWSALGAGMNGPVNALAVSGTNVYVGGTFTMADGSAANRIAKWNGSAWSALGTGLDNYVNALAVSGTNLYAGGLFTTAGGNAANYIAKWNGSAWATLGTGLDNYVNALAFSPRRAGARPAALPGGTGARGQL